MSTPGRTGLSTFALAELARYTREGTTGSIPSDADHRLFYVGRDDVHGILLELHSRFTLSLRGNMFGFDDQALNDAIWQAVEDPTIFVRESATLREASSTAASPTKAQRTGQPPVKERSSRARPRPEAPDTRRRIIR